MTEGAATMAIRAIAIGIFRRGDRILVGHGHDAVKGERYCRPPGGAIEFGERAAHALRREMLEEVRAEIDEPRLLGVLENTFMLEGVPPIPNPQSPHASGRPLTRQRAAHTKLAASSMLPVPE